MAKRIKVFTCNTKYYRFNGEHSKDGMLKKDDIFRIRQVTQTSEAKYSWSLEKIYNNTFFHFLSDGCWHSDPVNGSEPNFKEAQEFVKDNYPEAIEIDFFVPKFSFFGDKNKIENIKNKISELLEKEFGENDITICEDFNWDYIG